MAARTSMRSSGWIRYTVPRRCLCSPVREHDSEVHHSYRASRDSAPQASSSLKYPVSARAEHSARAISRSRDTHVTSCSLANSANEINTTFALPEIP